MGVCFTLQSHKLLSNCNEYTLRSRINALYGVILDDMQLFLGHRTHILASCTDKLQNICDFNNATAYVYGRDPQPQSNK